MIRFTSEAREGANDHLRLEAAGALDDLGRALVAHEVDDETLTRIAIVARSLRSHLEQGPRRVRSAARHGSRSPMGSAGSAAVTSAPLSEMA